MRRPVVLQVVLLLVVSIPLVTQGAGMAFDENFTVSAPDQPLADEVLAAAGAFRKEVAQTWFGAELPPGAGRAMIHVRLAEADDSAFTWAADSPNRKLHMVSLVTPRRAAAGATLRHEIVHVVLAARFPDRLPAWIEEGIAGRYDDPPRTDARRRIIRGWVLSGNWPDLERVFALETIAAHEHAAYSAAASVTEYLLSCGGKEKLLRFAVSGKGDGWDQALRRHYGLGSVHDLETAWRAWVSRPSSVVSASVAERAFLSP
jgi:hypothetical protein